MKKFFVFGIALATSLLATAQDDTDIVSDGGREVATNKKGQVITPQAEDISIAIDAQPVVNFARDVINFNGTGATTATGITSTQGGQRFIGRYFVNESTAYRGIFQFDVNGSITKTQQTSANDANKTGIDVNRAKTTGVALGGGLEKRRGYGRLQGFYGGQAIITFTGTSVKNTYELDAKDHPTTSAGGSRTLSQKNGTSIGVNLQGLVGVEYYFARKMSIGAEMYWGFGYNTVPKTSVETETYTVVGDKTETKTTEGVSALNPTNGLTTQASGDVYISFTF